MHGPEQFAENPALQEAEYVYDAAQARLEEAVGILYPDQPDANPLEVLPSAHEVRDTAEPLDITDEQADQLRTLGAEFGFGRRENRNLSELGLYRAHAVIEGGQAHKMMAEALVVAGDTATTPASYVFVANGQRQIDAGSAEFTATQRTLGLSAEEVAGMTEFDAARKVAESLPGFAPLEEDTVHNFSYDIHAENATATDPSGQLRTIGHVGNAPVQMLRIDREAYVDYSGAAKHRLQPDGAAAMKILDAYHSALGDKSAYGFVTGGTYQVSREVYAAQAGLDTGRIIKVPTYGTEQLALAKGEETPAPGPLHQLPGELHTAAESNLKLADAIAKARQADEAAQVAFAERVMRGIPGLDRAVPATSRTEAQPDNDVPLPNRPGDVHSQAQAAEADRVAGDIVRQHDWDRQQPDHERPEADPDKPDDLNETWRQRFESGEFGGA